MNLEELEKSGLNNFASPGATALFRHQITRLKYKNSDKKKKNNGKIALPVVSLSCYVCTSFSIAIAKINKGTSEIHSISTSIDSRAVSTIGNTIEKITYSSAGYNAVLAVREICKKKKRKKEKERIDSY